MGAGEFNARYFKTAKIVIVFYIPIDELLGEKSELVERAVKGDIQEYLEHNDI